jgi:outer membrane protein, heavy metal efflux system
MPFSLIRSACLCACALLSFTCSGLSVAAEPAQVLTLRDALTKTLAHNPDLKAFGFEIEAQAGRRQQAGARPSPEVGLLLENALGSGAHSSLDVAETTLSIGFAIERGARERRIDVADAGTGMLETEGTIRRLDLAAETARRYIAVPEGQSQLTQSKNAVRLGEQTLLAVQARVRAAKVPPAEDARAQAQLARMRLDEEHAEHELLAARRRLAALWGDTNADFGDTSGDLASLPPLEPFEALRSRLQQNPDFSRLVSEKRVREAELRLAEMRRRPPWQLTAGVRRFEDAGDHAFIVGVTVPLGSRDLARGAILEARANAAGVDARGEALRVRLDAELFGLYQELRHAYAEVTTLASDVLPRMEEAEQQSRYAYERGRYSYIEWAAAQRELLDARRALLEASANVHRHRIEIEHLTGGALTAAMLPREIS